MDELDVLKINDDDDCVYCVLWIGSNNFHTRSTNAKKYDEAIFDKNLEYGTEAEIQLPQISVSIT